MKRRGSNEGSIYQRADGLWAATLNLGWQGGRRVRKTYYTKTRKAAHERLATAQREMAAGVRPGTRRETVGAYLADWLDAIRDTVRPSTHRRYRQIVANQLVPHLGRIPLSKLTPSDVEAMLRRIDVSPRTASHARAVLRTALARAARHGLVARNAAALAAAPRVPQREIRSLSPDEARAFLLAIAGHRHRALFTLAITSGMRQGELLGLRWNDVDLGAGTLTVRHALQWVDDQSQLVETKSAKSRRTLPLAEVAWQALREAPRDSVWVFPGDAGQPLHPGTAYHALQDVLRDAGLPRVTFHALRHTAASLLLAQGTHPRVVMEMLGHSQIALTMNTYSHVIPSLEREAAERMNALLSS